MTVGAMQVTKIAQVDLQSLQALKSFVFGIDRLKAVFE